MEKIKKKRLDLYLVENNYFESREKARIAIMEGLVFVNEQKEDKPGTMIKENARVEFRGEKLKYVSRGGLKLEKAKNVFNIDFNDKLCADIGASTGGFTDLMLQNGARKVFAIDSGTNQLDYKIRCNEKVVALENTNARYLKIDDISKEKIDIVTIDVSFISLTKILIVAKDLLKDNGIVISLIKPQFEAGREKVEKNGVIRDKNVHIEVIKKVIDYSLSIGFKFLGLDYSPIKGPAGNIEFLLMLKNDFNENNNLDENMNFNKIIEDTVNNAHKELNV